MRAIVVGGSIGGLFAANILERAGWEVVVAERTSEPLSARGAGVVTHPELFAALAAAGIAEETLETVAVEKRVNFGADGRRTHVLDLPQRLVAWGELHGRLEASLSKTTIMRGAAVARLEEAPGSVAIELSDGNRLEADLVVGADGFRSSIRRFLLPEENLHYAGYVAWRGLVSEQDLPADIADEVMTCFSFGFPAGEQIVGYPVARPSGASLDGGRQFNYVWYRPVENQSALDALLTDASGRLFRDGIPPALLPKPVVENMRAAALALLAPPLAAAVRATRQPLLQPIYDYTASRFAVGRVALVGDAAAVARPHCGMGVTKAGSDAALLVRNLQEVLGDVPQALELYDLARRPVSKALVRHAQKLGGSIGSSKLAAQDMLIGRLMREIAVAPDISGAA